MFFRPGGPENVLFAPSNEVTSMTAKSFGIALLAMVVAPVAVCTIIARADSPATAPAEVNPQLLGMVRGGPATQPVADDGITLGDRYTNQLYGISLQPPANTKQIDKPTPDVIVAFDDVPAKAELRVWRDALETSIPLNSVMDSHGIRQNGVVDAAVDSFRRSMPSAEILRNEIINVGRLNVGMIAVRYDSPDPATPRKLSQRAIIEVPNTNHELYYLLEYNVPGAPANQRAGVVDPVELQASRVFAKIVDSVALLDMTQIVEDQRQRLYNTRLLFVNWVSGHGVMIRTAIVPEQWQRIVKNGKDIGYSYIVEDIIENPKQADDYSIRIGVKSRIVPSEKVELNFGWNLTASLDRKHETWSTVGREANDKGETISNYLQSGSSDEATKSVSLKRPDVSDTGTINLDKDTGPLGMGAGVDVRTVRTLTVDTTESQVHLQPFQQDTPVYFIPQAFANLLPRIMPLDRPKKYMFATFVSAAQTGLVGQGAGLVMARYVEVSPIEPVDFNGQSYAAAVAVTDRIGLDGDITTTYLTPQGKFIGSMAKHMENGQTVTTLVIPSTRETLQSLWTHPDLTRPETGAATEGPARGEIAQ
jgi:hypothetical protein